ncbi:hypothetical protein [Psittacicella hinzii]|nr:hypothetical protein [Psittacicella hinzii]
MRKRLPYLPVDEAFETLPVKPNDSIRRILFHNVDNMRILSSEKL